MKWGVISETSELFPTLGEERRLLKAGKGDGKCVCSNCSNKFICGCKMVRYRHGIWRIYHYGANEKTSHTCHLKAAIGRITVSPEKARNGVITINKIYCSQAAKLRDYFYCKSEWNVFSFVSKMITFYTISIWQDGAPSISWSADAPTTESGKQRAAWHGRAPPSQDEGLRRRREYSSGEAAAWWGKWNGSLKQFRIWWLQGKTSRRGIKCQEVLKQGLLAH